MAGSALTLFVLRLKNARNTVDADENATENNKAEVKWEGKSQTSSECEKANSQGDVSGNPPYQPKKTIRRGSFILDDDGQRRHIHAAMGTSSDIEIDLEDKYASLFSDDKSVQRAREFDEHVVSKLSTLDESKLLLHRTRAVR